MNPSTDPTLIFTDRGHKNSFNMTNSYNTRDVDQSPHILESLSPLEPRLCHQDVRTRLLDSLGDWLSQTEDFINWLMAGVNQSWPLFLALALWGLGKLTLGRRAHS